MTVVECFSTSLVGTITNSAVTLTPWFSAKLIVYGIHTILRYTLVRFISSISMVLHVLHLNDIFT